ncbi:hypothetical protein [Sphingomonas sp. LaA6.9]|uniref:hypothetical protein n=1 Tax=Sphingomonas sp. LaA6.9 TaxID=2919914 RepID=UPI001F4FBC7C|nr:hypothetical protein [Sphingomonas sp. LaA6.9]MCJ8159642.1 hypothetical protein [Sphingomonas sp. LaA6.9]
MAQERIRVVLHVKDLKALDGLHIDNGCMPYREREDGTIEMVAGVSKATLEKLKQKRSVTIEIQGDTKAEAKRAHDDVSRTNRYADGSLPTPLGSRGSRHVD